MYFSQSNRRQLKSYICFCTQSAVVQLHLASGQSHHTKICKNYYQNSIDHTDPLKRFPDDTLKNTALK